MSQRIVPETLDWHRQSANWLVGMSTAGLAWLGSMFPKVEVASPVLLSVYYVALVLLGVAMIAGIVFYLSLTSFGNAFEEEHDARMELRELKDVKNIGHASRIQEIESELAQLRGWADGRKRIFRYAYRTLVVAFPLSVLAALCFLITLGQHKGASTSPSYFLFDARNEVGSGSHISVYRVVPDSSYVLQLIVDSAGAMRWARMDPRTLQVVRSAVE